MARNTSSCTFYIDKLNLQLDRKMENLDEEIAGGEKPSSQDPEADPRVANHLRAFARRPPSRQWSISTVKSLDISSNIPKIAVAMDAEDSPWGGMLIPPPIVQFPHALTQPPRCSITLKFGRKPQQRCRSRRARSVPLSVSIIHAG